MCNTPAKRLPCMTTTTTLKHSAPPELLLQRLFDFGFKNDTRDDLGLTPAGISLVESLLGDLIHTTQSLAHHKQQKQGIREGNTDDVNRRQHLWRWKQGASTYWSEDGQGVCIYIWCDGAITFRVRLFVDVYLLTSSWCALVHPMPMEKLTGVRSQSQRSKDDLKQHATHVLAKAVPYLVTLAAVDTSCGHASSAS